MFAPKGANSPPARRSRAIRIHFGGDGGKRQPCGLLPPKVAKRPEGGERNERWARLAPAAKIERPGKAGRYELTLEGRRALQTSRKGFVSDLGRPTGRLFFAWVEKEAKNAPKPCKKRKSPSDDPPSIFSKGTANEKNRQNHTETVQKERRNVMPRMSRKRWEEWDFFLNRRDRITCNDLCRNCRHGCKRASGRRSWPAGSTGARGAKHGGNAYHGHAPEQGPHDCPMLERSNGLCQKPRQERTMSLLFL